MGEPIEIRRSKFESLPPEELVDGSQCAWRPRLSQHIDVPGGTDTGDAVLNSVQPSTLQ